MEAGQSSFNGRKPPDRQKDRKNSSLGHENPNTASLVFGSVPATDGGFVHDRSAEIGEEDMNIVDHGSRIAEFATLQQPNVGFARNSAPGVQEFSAQATITQGREQQLGLPGDSPVGLIQSSQRGGEVLVPTAQCAQSVSTQTLPAGGIHAFNLPNFGSNSWAGPIGGNSITYKSQHNEPNSDIGLQEIQMEGAPPLLRAWAACTRMLRQSLRRWIPLISYRKTILSYQKRSRPLLTPLTSLYGLPITTNLGPCGLPRTDQLILLLPHVAETPIVR